MITADISPGVAWAAEYDIPAAMLVTVKVLSNDKIDVFLTAQMAERHY